MAAKTLKFACWNVNGLRAASNKGFWEWFAKTDADFVCLQEAKISFKDFQQICLLKNIETLSAPPFDALPDFCRNFHAFLNPAERPGYSGTAIICRHTPDHVEFGIGDKKFDAEGRVIILHYPNFCLVNAYVPNSGRELDRLPFKLAFGKAFIKKLQALRKKQKNIIVCGDMNVAHREIDIKNAKANVKNAGFTPQERAWFDEWLSHDYIDTFRHLHPDLKDQYTWWSYRFDARSRNIGWRIDYFVTSKEVLPLVKASEIEPQQMGSDHCPVHLELVLQI